MWRTRTIVTQRIGTATMSPIAPSSAPMIRTLAIVSTGGSSTLRCMMRGTTTFASKMCTSTPSSSTSTTFTQSPVATMNNAGRSVEISVPKNGTMATSPVKIPNANREGTMAWRHQRDEAIAVDRRLTGQVQGHHHDARSLDEQLAAPAQRPEERTAYKAHGVVHE